VSHFLIIIILGISIKFGVYDFDQFSRDNYLGEAKMSLTFLEYYGEKETEKITLQLTSDKKTAGTIDFTLSYKPLN